MRIMIKGGVWKNTEDEILKAAVMKYGKNQWARISSLLVRKSAKQCKARWYEWLDPSIKKTEWTREEDEKLLHMAKLMPTQWRTIAPIVGRTPAQCLERYEKLLDAAAAKDEAYDPADDPRKLRPGEIDPNPESKPARPDPVDMDEDEKEMLSEARARLANTRGKKAKRKAREKQLEEARRLASLQKKRELKAAGIELQYRKKKSKGVDYNAEIPFERKAPAGFYDVSGEEGPAVDPNFVNVNLDELEGKRRVDMEALLRKQDEERQRRREAQDMPGVVMEINKMNDPEQVRKRSKLMLPAPQISDRELEEIAKLDYANDLLLEAEGGDGATRALLASYGRTPGATPLRTPARTPGGTGDAIMMEAENLARLREMNTPLFGGENPTLHASDFSGITPKRSVVQTPNPIATPLRTPGGLIGMTPGATPAGRGVGMTPGRTPIRDELRINDGSETPMSASARAEKLRQAEQRQHLRAGLTNLPAPKMDYQIMVPELPGDDEEVEHMEEDAADVIMRQQEAQAAAEAAALRKRSSAIKRALPRPADVSTFTKTLQEELGDDVVPATKLELADRLVKAEMLALLEHDAVKYPVEDGRKKKGPHANGGAPMEAPALEDVDEEDLKEAEFLIAEEADILRSLWGHDAKEEDEYVETWEAVYSDYVWLPTQCRYELASVSNNADKLAAAQAEFERLKKQIEVELKRAQKLETKIGMVHGGYQMKAKEKWSAVEATYKQADILGTELECFKALFRQEQLSIPRRIESLKEDVRGQSERERSLQLWYENLLVEQEDLQRKIDEHEKGLTAAKRAAEERAAEEAKRHEEEIREKHRKEAEEAESVRAEKGEVSGRQSTPADGAENGENNNEDEEMVGPQVAMPAANANGPAEDGKNGEAIGAG
ncbi:cell division control protein [Klebsormidium nitens]|uniref:Cell division control protein n=1 Tax=Klebsormidium nitens TaxID=105231 RepID=A0A0U9HRM1_KLENI|nr:cell division control protein [Klebsormidium nitens]|eukprot:GAQ83036.1 cell division control protein [Klebsormidium nitens]